MGNRSEIHIQNTASGEPKAVFLCPKGGRARRRGRQRKTGDRHRNGRLRYHPSTDVGHEMTLARRMELAGADARDHRAGYPLGVLFLRRQLADPSSGDYDGENAARHDAGLRFAADHAVVFGVTTPKSHLASIVKGIRSEASGELDTTGKAEARYRRKVAAMLDRAGNGAAQRVVERIVIDEDYWLRLEELDLLRLGLSALVGL